MSAETAPDKNPFFAKWNTPFEVPDFSIITDAHFMPALEAAIGEQRAELAAIVTNPEGATFANTVEALEQTGELLKNVAGVFYNLQSAHTNDEINDIAQKIAPKLSALSDDIYLNQTLFERISAVHDRRAALGIATEQARLLEETHKSFVRGGANLPEGARARFREINERLAILSLQFGENVLQVDNSFELVLSTRDDLAGLPASVVQAAAEAATEHGHTGQWVFTLDMPSLIPFITHSQRRDLREKLYNGYLMRCDEGDVHDNNTILHEIALLRGERARLLGFDTHAHYVLDDNMAKTPANVYGLLDRLWAPALARAEAERDDMQRMIAEEGHDFKLEPWDWWYYAQKVKQAKYDFDDEVLRPYFELERVLTGMFELATRLWGITFTERSDIPRYQADVRAFVVKDVDESTLAVYLLDSYPRPSKRGGAWMNTFRSQYKRDSQRIVPIVVNVANVSKPTADTPALLSLDEVNTLFHEFGHALHGILSDCTYESLSGTSVPRDFVEMPSQVIENWATEPEMLKLYARHYQTGESIPDELIAKMKNAQLFNQGFATTEYLAASYLDMGWHTIEPSDDHAVDGFEKRCVDRIGLIPEIKPRYRSTYFRHIFSGGYASSYYSYIWAEVVDADAFEAFKENGVFDKETAAKFREHILSRGGTEEPMTLYKRFRGREPRIEPLLERRGLS